MWIECRRLGNIDVIGVDPHLSVRSHLHAQRDALSLQVSLVALMILSIALPAFAQGCNARGHAIQQCLAVG